MKYAVFDQGQIVEFREIQDWDSYPAHKKAAKDERGDGGATLRLVEYEGEGELETIVVEPARVRIIRTQPDVVVGVEDVKAEAQRRIVELVGARDFNHAVVKQLNIQMEVNYLNDFRLTGGVLTKEQEAWAVWARQLRLDIIKIRDKSDEIELMQPIPTDFYLNKYWS